ncbi:DUF5979 domain-containing protein [Streptacidiphilus cavernicola]|uniref:DUF5979 domain-containing protein n=1 Tax=Streptacidiphilus cavernicola TaxID=3342716 RepID=A0ABV6VQM3_9ACTN
MLQPNEPLQVGVALAYGSLKLEKKITAPSGQISAALSRVLFTFHVTCTISPQGHPRQTVLDQDYRVTTKQPETVTGIPAGAECSVWETSARGGSTDHPAANPAQVTIKPGLGNESVQTVSVANTFAFGALELVKSLDGAAAGYAGGQSFPIEVSCALPNGDGSASNLVLHKTYQVTPGTPVTIKPLPVNSRCWAQETDSEGAATITVDHGSADDPAVISAGGTARITVTNTYPAGQITVTKHVVNGAAGPYSFELACSTVRGPVELAPDDWAFRLKDGESRAVLVPAGAFCKVTEKDLPAGDQVSYTASGGSSDGSVTVHGSDSVEVTNTFPAPVPHGGGSGDLARTGGDDSLTVLSAATAVALLLAGLVLHQTGRHRRRGRA